MTIKAKILSCFLLLFLRPFNTYNTICYLPHIQETSTGFPSHPCKRQTNDKVICLSITLCKKLFNLLTVGDCRYVISLLEFLSLDRLLLLYTVSVYLATTFSIIIQLKIKISRKRFLITVWLYCGYNPRPDCIKQQQNLPHFKQILGDC